MKKKGDARLLEIYTDGACSGNPGPGGWGAVVVDDDTMVDEISERTPQTTNNREEMKAILWAIEMYGKESPLPVVWSDSAYCVNTFNTWMWNWKSNGWKRAKDQSIENLDLVKQYDSLISRGFRIDLRKIEGHAGHKWNEYADGLATGRIQCKGAEKFD